LNDFPFPPFNEERAYDIFGCFISNGRAKKRFCDLIGIGLVNAPASSFSVIIGAESCINCKQFKVVDVIFTSDELKKLDEISKLAPQYLAT
jgi:hypothetical protein